MTYNASNRKDIRRAEKAARVAQSIADEFLEAAMSTTQGRAWFYDLLSRCHIFADPFTGDSLREAYSKGERNIGLAIYADLVRLVPNQFIAMNQEAHVRELNNERSSSDSASGDTSPAYDSFDDPADAEHTGGQDTSGRDTESSISPLDAAYARWEARGKSGT